MGRIITPVRITLTTDAGGAADVTSELAVNGRVLQMRYTPDGTNPLDTNADIAVTGKQSGTAIVTKANIGTSAFTLAPRQPTHKTADGSAALYAAAGEAVNDFVYLAGERIRVVVAQGGAAKSGVLEFLIG